VIFFSRRLVSRNTVHKRPTLTLRCNSRSRRARNFASVRSDWDAIHKRKRSRTSAVNLLVRPRLAPGGRSIWPLCSNARNTFLADPTLTLNRAAKLGRLPSPRW